MTGYFCSLYYRLSLFSPALSLFALHLLQALDLFHVFSFISLSYLFQINTAIFYSKNFLCHFGVYSFVVWGL